MKYSDTPAIDKAQSARTLDGLCLDIDLINDKIGCHLFAPWLLTCCKAMTRADAAAAVAYLRQRVQDAVDTDFTQARWEAANRPA